MRDRGKFIVIDGLVGGGKSTVTKWIEKNWPSDRKLLVTREPGGTLVSEAFRYAVQSPEIPERRHPITSLLGYSAARAQLVFTKILPALEKGIDVWADRYWSSTWAFQGQDVPKDQIRIISEIATGGLLPDKWLYLTGNVAVLLRRKANQKDGLGQHDDVWDLRPDLVEFTRRTDVEYRELGDLYPERWRYIQADGRFGEKINQIGEVLATEGIFLRNMPDVNYDIG